MSCKDFFYVFVRIYIFQATGSLSLGHHMGPMEKGCVYSGGKYMKTVGLGLGTAILFK